MRKTISIVLASAIALQGCAAITRDLRSPGGYPGYLLDKRMFDASRSKEVQLLRFTIILAMAARMGGETARDSKDADAVAEYLAASADEINFAAANIYDVAGIPPCKVKVAPPPAGTSCSGYFVNFEADIPLIEYRMMRLLFSVLPQDHIRKFAEDIQKGNFMGSAMNAIRVVFVGVKGLHTATGSYRTGQEALVANTKCGSLTSLAGQYLDEAVFTVRDAVSCLGLSPNSLFGPHPNEITADELRGPISQETFKALMLVARTSCVRLSIGTADNSGTQLVKAREQRAELCAKVAWRPKGRADMIDAIADQKGMLTP